MGLRRSRNKLGNKKIVAHGIEFDSKREARRYSELLLLAKAGKIENLDTQVTFELIPSMFDNIPTGEVYQRGEHKGEPKYRRVCIEHGINYVADFVYDTPSGRVVEDAKGFRDPSSAAYKVFVMKRKLMLYKYGIRVKEV